MINSANILLAFYGDDFTGSTDALECISRAGAKALLFTETPTEAQLNAFPGLNAFGVAGMTRALSPDQMEQVLLPAFLQLKNTGARHVHYKVCSTFDSSPVIGSIGKAIDCGANIFNQKGYPVMGGMPALGRYCLFGNLFARMGIGSKGKIYRLDRHPSMSIHPVTPADESDLRIHLGKQTNKSIGLIDIVQIENDIHHWLDNTTEDLVLIDSLHDSHCEKIGAWLELQTKENNQLFSIGSSGVEYALGLHWNKELVLQPVHQWTSVEKANPLLVVSGSCSPVTSAQIEWSISQGFAELIIDAKQIAEGDLLPAEVLEKVNSILQQGKHLIVHTGKKQSNNLPAEKLGTALGAIARHAVIESGVKRVVISGGDTSSYAARAMEIDAVEMIAPLVTGAPLCKAYSRNEAINGIQVNFKGGQVGDERYFGILANGD